MVERVCWKHWASFFFVYAEKVARSVFVLKNTHHAHLLSVFCSCSSRYYLVDYITSPLTFSSTQNSFYLDIFLPEKENGGGWLHHHFC